MTTHDLNLEKQAIGALMLAPGLLAHAGHLSDDVFTDSQHAKLWAFVVKAILQNVSTSPTGLMNFDRNMVMSLGGLNVLEDYRQAGQSIVTEAPLAFERLHELHQWRKIHTIAGRLDNAAKRQDKSPDEILSSVIHLAQTLLANGRDTTSSKRDIITNALSRATKTKQITTTGLTPLDFLMQGGLQSKRLYGFGGLYGRGKTILLGSISDNLNMQNVPHLFISLETDPEDIEIRTCAKHFNTNASLLLDPHSEAHETLHQHATQYVERIPEHTWYEFAPGATMNDIHRMILRAKARHNIEGFILDYWQLIEGKERGQGEEAHHRSNANRMAALCRQENLWGIVSAQIDEKGKLKYSDSLLQAAALYVRMMRDEDDELVHFEIQKSNYTRYGTTSGTSMPTVLFDMVSGPHIRDTDATDTGHLAQDSSDKIDL